MESRRRSLIKSLSWRLSASLLTVLIVYLWTREIALALLGIGMTEFFAKLVWFFCHERLWLRINWGKTR